MRNKPLRTAPEAETGSADQVRKADVQQLNSREGRRWSHDRPSANQQAATSTAVLHRAQPQLDWSVSSNTSYTRRGWMTAWNDVLTCYWHIIIIITVIAYLTTNDREWVVIDNASLHHTQRQKHPFCISSYNTHTHIHTPTHTHTRLTALFPGLPGWAGTRKVNQSGFYWSKRQCDRGISWAICKSAPRSRQITTPAPHHSVFHRPDALPATQPTASKHWRQQIIIIKRVPKCIKTGGSVLFIIQGQRR